MFNRSINQWAFIGLAAVVLTACSTPENQLEQVERSAEELYMIAYDEATKGEINKASPLFDEVERQHPYSKWATQAQLMSAWALYESNN